MIGLISRLGKQEGWLAHFIGPIPCNKVIADAGTNQLFVCDKFMTLIKNHQQAIVINI